MYLLCWIHMLLHELLDLQQNVLAFPALTEQLSRNAARRAAAAERQPGGEQSTQQVRPDFPS